MKQNIGPADRIVRLLVSILLFLIYFSGNVSNGVAITCLVLGFLMAATAIVGICPIYTLLGINTRKKGKGELL